MEVKVKGGTIIGVWEEPKKKEEPKKDEKPKKTK